MTSSRQRTPIDTIAEAWVDTLVQLEPMIGTYIGRTEGDHRLPDFSPEGADAIADAERATLEALSTANIVDAIDAFTLADLSAELRLGLEQHAAQEHLRDLNVIESPPQQIREIFDLMATEHEHE